MRLPDSAKDQHGGKFRLRLLSIPVSHYCEKARWGLERARLEYEEVRHIQLFHYASTWWHARSLYAPVLLTPDGPITDSTSILRYADRHLPAEETLFPAFAEEQIARFVDVFDRIVGVEARRWLYYAGFEHLGTAGMVELAAQGTPRWQAPLARALMPLARSYLRARLGVTRGRVESGLRELRRVFEWVGSELGHGRPYLLGERLTAADLTFASLSALILMPSEYGVRLPAVTDLPKPMRDTVAAFRETPAGDFALRLFANERVRPAVVDQLRV